MKKAKFNKSCHSLFVILLLVVAHSAMGQSFAPNFVPEGCSPMLAEFIAPEGYWDFGNGNYVRLGVNAGGGRLFGAGEYKIRYKNADTGEITEVGTLKVHASPAAQLKVNGPLSGCAPMTVQFEDITLPPSSNSQIVKRIWDFGPTGKETTEATASYTYTVPGVYTIKLIVETDLGCKNVVEKTKYITITKPPVLGFTVNRDKSCEPFFAELNNTSTGVATGSVYRWEAFGPDQKLIPVSTGTTGKPGFITSTDGTYSVRLTITEPLGCQTVLEKKNLVTVTSNGLQSPGFNYSLSPTSVQCNAMNGEFTPIWKNSLIAGQRVDWEIIDPAGKITQKTNLPSLTGTNKIVFNTAGTWKVRVKASGGTYACSTSGPFEQKIVIVLGQAVPAFNIQDSVSCVLPHTVSFDASPSKNAVSYQWDFDNNGTIDASGEQVSKTFTTYGTKSVRLIVKDENGCQKELIKKEYIYLEAITAHLSAMPMEGCNDENGNFTVNFRDGSQSVVPITNWKWEFFDEANNLVGLVEGSDPKVHQHPAFKFHTSSTAGRASYWAKLTVSSANGCTSTTISSPNLVKVGNKPKASFTANPPLGCQRTNVTFTYTGSQPYDSLHWFPLGYDGIRFSVLPPFGPDFEYEYKAKPNRYVAGLVVWNGPCSDSTFYSAENPGDPSFLLLAPLAYFTLTLDPCQPGLTTLNDASTGAQFWRWDFGSDQIPNPYPAGKAQRDFEGGLVPHKLKNPTITYPPGTYQVRLSVSADNIIYVLDPVTGKRLKNKLFEQTGQKTTYSKLPTGELLLFGTFATEDSVYFRRCHDQYDLKLIVPDFANIDAIITSNYNSSLPNCYPVAVDFNNNTPGATTWKWTLGNGETSTVKSPKGIQYKDPGKYTVTLEVTTSAGCKYKKTYPDYVVVKGPIVNFNTSDPEICLGGSIRFTDASTSAESIRYRTWTMGNGTVFSNDPSIINASPIPPGTPEDLSIFDYTFPAVLPLPSLQKDGISVTLTVTYASGCKKAKTVKVRPTLPKPYFDLSVQMVDCEEAEVKVSVKNPDQLGFAPFRYTWLVYERGTTNPIIAQSGPDANASPTFRLKSKSATEAAEYDIRLILEDNKYARSTSGKGCTAEISKSVTIQPYQYKVNFSYNQPGICPPFKVQFTDLSEPQVDIASWEWDFGDGSPHSTVQHPLKIYQRPNLSGYYIQLTVTFKNGCKKTFKHPGPIVIPGIIGSFTVKQLEGSPKKLPGVIVTEGAVTDYVRGTFTPHDFRVQFDAVVDPVDQPNVGYFIWDFGNGTEVTTNPSVTREYSLSDVYYPRLAIVNKIGCRYETFTDIQIVANACEAPQIMALPKQCHHAVALLKGIKPTRSIGKMEVTWSNLTDGTILYQGTQLDSVPEVKYTFTHPIDVGLKVSDEGGCISFNVRHFDVFPQLFAEAGTDQEICFKSNLHLNGSSWGGSDNYQFTWTVLNQTKTGVATAFSDLPVGKHRVHLLVMDLASRCTATDSMMVKVYSPVVVFTKAEAIVCSDGQVTLRAEASGGKGNHSFRWSAGAGAGGQTSPLGALSEPTSATPTFSLANSGTSAQEYTYYVTATDELHCVSTPRQVKITVTPPLTISLDNPGIICYGKQVKLTGTVSGGNGNPANWAYRWSKVSGNRNSGELDDPQALAPVATPRDILSTYRLEVFETVEGVARCTAAKEIIIQQSPQIIVRIDSVAPHCYGSIHIPVTAQVSGGTGNYSFQWTRVSSNPVTLTDNDRKTVYINRLDGTTELLLRVIDKDAVGPVCPVETRVVVRSLLPVPDAGKDQAVCVGQSITLSASATGGLAPYRFQWTLISRPSPGTATDADGLLDKDISAKIPNPTFLATNEVGTYVYELNVVDRLNCPSGLVSRLKIQVHPLPEAPNIKGRTVYCAGETIYLQASGYPTGVFNWYMLRPGQQSAFHQKSQLTTKAIQNTLFYVTQTHPITGCESKAREVKITVNQVPGLPVVESPSPYCEGENIAPLIARRKQTAWITRWYADFAQTSLLHIGDTLKTGLTGIPGYWDYYVTQSNEGCESASTKVGVLVNEIPPAPLVSPSVTYCQNEEIIHLLAKGWNLNWYQDAKLTSAVGKGGSFSPPIQGSVGNFSYYVTQTINGCLSPPASVTINILPLPQASTETVSIRYCFEEEKRLQLQAPTGPYYYKWEHNGVTTPTVEVTNGGNYFLSITNEPGGCAIRKEYIVTEVCPWRIFLPNAFTPNNDGRNDNWQLFGAHFYDLDLTVYNRWGEVIYISKDQSEPWNGTFRGELVPLGTYIWELKAKASLDDAPIQMRGTVSVIR